MFYCSDFVQFSPFPRVLNILRFYFNLLLRRVSSVLAVYRQHHNAYVYEIFIIFKNMDNIVHY